MCYRLGLYNNERMSRHGSYGVESSSQAGIHLRESPATLGAIQDDQMAMKPLQQHGRFDGGNRADIATNS